MTGRREGGGYFRQSLFCEDKNNVNITQTKLYEVHIFNKKHLLLTCVVYRLTPCFLIQAMDLFF